MKILILRDNVSDESTPDEIDTLIEAQSVHKISHELGHVPILVNVDNDLNKLKNDIIKNKPDLMDPEKCLIRFPHYWKKCKYLIPGKAVKQ